MRSQIKLAIAVAVATLGADIAVFSRVRTIVRASCSGFQRYDCWKCPNHSEYRYNTRQLCAQTEVFPSPTPEAPEAHLHECPNCSGDGYKTPQFFAFPKSN